MKQKVILTDVRKKDYLYEEAIKTLRTNIQFTGKNVKTIMFTSCFPNEGKSDVTFQLAQEIGNMGKRVLLIDADIIAKESDGAVLIIESERVSYKVAQKVKEQMEKTGCKLLGVVLNKVNIEKEKYYGKYDYYYSNNKKDKR